MTLVPLAVDYYVSGKSVPLIIPRPPCSARRAEGCDVRLVPQVPGQVPGGVQEPCRVRGPI